MKTKMNKVVIIYPFFPHYRKAMIEELISHGKYHYVFAGSTSDPTRSGIEVCSINPNRFIQNHFKLFGNFFMQTGVITIAFRRDISTIIYFGDAKFLTTWLSAALARITGKRVLFWSHGWPRVEKGIKDWVRGLFYRLGHGLILYNNFSKAIGVSKGFNPNKLYIIYNSLDYDEQKEWREKITERDIYQKRVELFKVPDRPVIINIGRLVEYKHLDMLIEALGLLKKQDFYVNFLLIGDGPERSTLERLAKEYEVNDATVFLGDCYEEGTLAKLISLANVTVIPGRVGLTAMHSFAYGVPVISHNNPNDQHPEWEAIIPGLTGDLYTYGDVEDLARVIRVWTNDEFLSNINRSACFDLIEKYYNPTYQRIVMDQAVSAEGATDILWEKWLPLVKGRVFQVNK